MNGSPRPFAAIGVLGLVALVVGGAWQSAGAIQSEIEGRATAALTEAGVSDVQVAAHGMDVCVVAASAEAARQARSVLEPVDGVRQVTLEVPGLSSEQIEAAAPSPSDTSVGGTSPATPSGSPTAPPSVSPTADPRDSIQFEAGSADLTPEATAQVHVIVAYLRDNPTMRLATVGVAGDVADRDRALDVSLQRAKTVSDAVVAGGIDPSRVAYTGSAALVGPGGGEGRVDVTYEER